MIKTILVGGLALSIICFFLAQNGSNRSRSRIQSTRYGPPKPLTRNEETSTEPHFRILISPKATTTTEGPPNISVPILDPEIVQNFTDFLNFNETGLNEFLNAVLNNVTDKPEPATNIQTEVYENFTPNFTTSKPIGSSVTSIPFQLEVITEVSKTRRIEFSTHVTESVKERDNNAGPTTFPYEKAKEVSPIPITKTPFPSSSSFLIQSTTISSFNQRRFEHATESDIDSQGLHLDLYSTSINPPKRPASFYEYVTEKSSHLTESVTEGLSRSNIKSVETVTESQLEDLNNSNPVNTYLPPQPSLSRRVGAQANSLQQLQVPKNDFITIPKNITQPPSRLYLPPRS